MLFTYLSPTFLAMKQFALVLYSVLLLVFSLWGDVSWARKPAARVATSSGTQSTQQVYNNLLDQQQNIGLQISTLSLQLHSASASKGRKITHQINLLNDNLVVIERKLAAFPSKYTGVSNPNAEHIATVDRSFADQLDSIATVRVAANNPFAGQLSQDPELDRMYRAYLKTYGDGTSYSNQVAGDRKGVVYRVMVSISKARLSLAQFAGVPDVMEQAMPSGGYAYYSGQYGSLDEAQGACDQILSRHKFRNAFVVAMEGNRRVPIK